MYTELDIIHVHIFIKVMSMSILSNNMAMNSMKSSIFILLVMELQILTLVYTI